MTENNWRKIPARTTVTNSASLCCKDDKAYHKLWTFERIVDIYEDEVWLPVDPADIRGIQGVEASSYGRVRHPENNKGGRPALIAVVPDQYVRIRIANLRASVHVLVLLAFKREELTKIQAKNPGKRIEVDHRASASKHNNVPTNLDWVTRSENMRRSFYGLDFDEDDEEEAEEV
jgi:hypothetical protein